MNDMTGESYALIARDVLWTLPSHKEAALTNDQGTLYLSTKSIEGLLQEWDQTSDVIHHFTDVPTQKPGQIYISAELMSELLKEFSK